VAVCALFFAVFSPSPAQAGWLSFFDSSLFADKASADIVQTLASSSSLQNVQTMPLLQATTNPSSKSVACIDSLPIRGNVLDATIATEVVTCSQKNTIISTYTVHEGDTISDVAYMFGVSVNTILWANNLSSGSVLREGQVLTILPISGITYTVKKGDTLQSIAKKYGRDHVEGTLGDILDYNDLQLSARVSVGQRIIIPSAEIEVADTTSHAHDVGPEPVLDNVKNLPTFKSCVVAEPGCYFLRPVATGSVSQKLHGHNGIDIAAPVGTPIRASAPGIVIVSRVNGGWNGGYGNFIVISHDNGTQTLYAHMQSSIVIPVGTTVKQGEKIGTIGMSGLTTGPHLHFEIRGAKNLFGNL
jgi:LysM repeat protein